jgi:hypothetical protein
LTVELRRYDNAASFRAAVWPFLADHEAENNLLLGIGGGLDGEGYAPPSGPYLAALLDGDDVLVVALLTPGYRLVLSQPHGDPPLALIADDLFDQGWAPIGVLAPTAQAHAFARHWSDRTRATFKLATRETIYQLRDLNPPPTMPGYLRPFRPEDRDLAINWVHGFHRDALHKEIAPETAAELVDRRLASTPPTAFIWDDDGPRSMAMVGRPTPNGICISGVYTPPEHRSRGYARASVGAVSAKMLAEGRQFCFLFADADYATSNFVYQSLGYEPVTEVQEIDFIAPPP